MLAFQIALGVVLAAVLLRFWRQSLWIVGGLVTLCLLIVFGLIATSRGWIDWERIGVIVAAVTMAAGIRVWQRRHQPPVR